MNDHGLSLEPNNTDNTPEPSRSGGGNNSGGRVVRILLILMASLCGMATLCVGGFAYVIYRSTQPVADVGSAFLQAIADEDYQAVFSNLDDGLQSEYGSAEALGTALQAENVQPQRWSFNSRSVDSGTAELGSTVIMANGTRKEVSIGLRWTGNLWLIESFAFDLPVFQE